ncbi:hypothetical protein HPB52_025497 [Rhipicephalus sanguineus]|uniref:Peptidase M13 C-terminal domain-containing protein n=1 Tax=Rhipicephalus sanguineus TaxID=34632 RepID=A0A9D4TCY4_RHISA|nr:hypothetical protein HPB52_025497 [Rhipicephalus sanguineus]
MRVVDEALRRYGLSNRTSLLNNWMDITAAVSTINATFRDRISTTVTRDLVANHQYSFYDNGSEALCLPPLFSMLPLYRQSLGETAKFGSLGTLFATAIFQLYLSKINSYPSIMDEALKRLRCFTELAEHRSDSLELYHQAASVKLALQALQSHSNKDNQRLRIFRSDQVFFVVMCYLLCNPNTSEHVILAEAICNEAVRNSREFSTAFGCPAGTPMHPWERCTFF